MYNIKVILNVCRFGKKIRYEFWKFLVDMKKWLKGRFIKVDVEYDYDLWVNNIIKEVYKIKI